MRKRNWPERAGALSGLATLALGVGWLAACGSSTTSDASFGGGDFGGGDAASSNEPGSGGAPADDAGVPAEQEQESTYQSPVATGRYVWVANPTSGRVAYINATTLEVKTVEAGNGPTYVAGVASGQDDAALVLNVLSDDATLLRANAGGQVTASTFPTAHGMNAIATSSDGRWAIAWTNNAQVSSTDRADKTQGFQDLTVIDLTGQVPSTVLAVGYRPVKVGFTTPANHAFAVTQDGVSMVNLTASAPIVEKNVAISDNPLEDPGTRDVSVTPDGAYAMVRRDNQAGITIVSLDSGTRVTATMPGAVTDLDLSDNGDKAVAVIRESATVAVLPVPGIFNDPATFATTTITGETVGSVSLTAGGGAGLLYTNAVPVEHLTVLSLDQALTHRTVRLYSPVLAVFPSPNAQYAVVLHAKPTTGTKAGAFSLVPIGADLPAKIVGTDAPPIAVAVSPASDRAVVAERDDGKQIYGVYLGRMPSFMVDRYPLASPPLAVGIVAGARRAYVAQKHPEGRITFLDLDNGQARTLTGFELAARVVDGSKP